MSKGNPAWFAIIAASLLAVMVYFAISVSIIGLGFPLDDAWIHQTYARNLAQSGSWSFLPGEISGGSTSPLWTFWLALGHGLNSGPFLLTFLGGYLGLVGLAIVGEKFFRSQVEMKGKIPWAGIFLAAEWHLVWAANSGMETALFSLLILAVLYELSRHPPRWLWIGCLVGLAVWTRPDGITLLGPVGLMALLGTIRSIRDKEGKTWVNPKSLSPLLYGGLGFLMLFIPYLLFNFNIAGQVWPNTYYAKQAEYSATLQSPLIERLGSIFMLPLIGGGLLLLPGGLFAIWKAIGTRNWVVSAGILWWFGYNLVYTFTLPLTYQHGRYLIPSMPVFFVLGWIGTAWLWQENLGLGRVPVVKKKISHRFRRIVQVAWQSGVILLTLAFLVLGALAYGQDVAVIETEMVATAHWLSENIPPSSLVAVHDIGAIGYFSNIRILDLAGLITPEVIPIIRDEPALASYLDSKGVDYLVVFPGWYPMLANTAIRVYQTGGRISPLLGGENMTVYLWRNSKP